MPTREDMNSAGQPFLALRREARVTAPEREIINAQSAGIAARDIRIMELEQAVSQLQGLVSEGCAKREAQAREISRLQEAVSALRRDLAQARELLNETQTVAIEWQSVAEDKQRQIEALRCANSELAAAAIKPDGPITKAERDACAAVEKLRPATEVPRMLTLKELQGPEGGHARNCACVHCAAPMTATDVRKRLEAVVYPPVAADPWGGFCVEALEKMAAARAQRMQVPGVVLIRDDGSTERVQPVDFVVSVDPAKPGADATAISHWVDGKPLRPHTFNSFTHICEACGLTEEEAMHPGTIRGCAG